MNRDPKKKKSEARFENRGGQVRIILNDVFYCGKRPPLPKVIDGFDLPAQPFRDILSISYGKEPIGLPKECDGCEQDFSIQHKLDCKKGGLVKKDIIN